MGRLLLSGLFFILSILGLDWRLGIWIHLHHSSPFDLEYAGEPTKHHLHLIVKAQSESHHENRELECENDLQRRKNLGHVQPGLCIVCHHICDCATGNTNEITQGPVQTTPCTQLSVIAYLFLPKTLYHTSEGYLPPVQFDELDALYDLTGGLYAFVLKGIYLMKKSPIHLGDTIREWHTQYYQYYSHHTRPS